ncbi:MAG TPA: family 78 glycoside hydrolase catalytic domain [Candidatus Limnocylindrales bacterium]
MTALPAAVDLRADHQVEPIGLDEPRPRLSWRVELAHPATEQASFAVEVARDPTFAPAAVVWTRSVVSADAAIVFDGPALASRERRFWRVRVADDRGVKGPWSAPASWEMGLLAPDDWVGRWIGWIDPAMASWSSRSPLLRRSFRLPGAAARGRAHVTALGLVELTINGRRVGTDRLAPGWTDYRRRIQVRTSDVLELLRPGENVVAARLGRGWFAGDVGQFGAEQYGDIPALMAQIEVDLAGGRRTIVATDTSWRAHPGPLVRDDLLMGESCDARDEPTGWDEPGFQDGDWRPVVVQAGPGGRLVAQRDPGVRVIDELEPRAIASVGPDRQIVDFGQNIAGHVRIQASESAGTTIVIRHAEALDPGGGLYTANLRTARQTDAYTFRGDGPEVFEPRFTSHGFRYAEISGLSGGIDPGRLTARVVSSMGPASGSFACSDVLVNRIHENVMWGLRGGLVGIPTDCPQRDERLGWTADVAAMAPSALFLGDTAPVFEKWLIDLSDAQLPSGAYPDIAPRIGVTGSGNAGWADAGMLVPWLIYERTGNVGVIERQYDSMLGFLRFLGADHIGGVRHGGRYGDWLALEGPTSLELIGTAYLARSAALFVRMARLLGHDGDADEVARLAARARAAFRRRFTTASGTLGEETQTGYALALGFDLLPRDARSTASDRLAHLIEAAGGHLLTGFLGTGLVLSALSDHGHHELATRLARQDTYPSWGYEVRQGATTIWERWNSWTPEDGFADPGMNSLNHAALGSVADWLHQHLAGLAPGAPGYRTMLVRPRPAAGIEWARAAHESPHGSHSVEWMADARHLEVTVEVPPNTFAEVVVPATGRTLSVAGHRPRSGARGVVRVASSAGEHRLTLSWGRHHIEVAR